MSNLFNSVFNSIYEVRIKCPSCKEKIHSHAKKCPYCHADLKSDEYEKLNNWQKKANIVLLIIVGIILFTMILNSVNFFASIVLCIVFYGLGYFIIIKIQSFLNSMK